MKRSIRSSSLACLLLAIALSASHAQTVPLTMAYQGYITDLSGTPIADGSYSFIFTIYPSEFGGSAMWTETHPNVVVNKGLFSVILGRGNPPVSLNIPFDQQYFLGIRVGTDPELSPRVRLATSAYSFRSLTANGVRDGSITDESVAPGANIAANKLHSTVLTESDIVAGSGVTVNNIGGTLTIAATPGTVTLAGDVVGPAGANVIAANAVTADKIAPDVVSSINNVSNDAGNINLVAGANVTITPNASAKTITIAAAGGGGLTLPYTGTVASNNPAIDLTNTGSGNALELHAASGYGIDVYNDSPTLSAARFWNANTASSASGIYVRSLGTSATITAKNTGSSTSGLIFEGYYGVASSRFKMLNTGELWTHGHVNSTHATMRDNLGGTATPAEGGYYRDNAVYAWANVYATGVMAHGFGCTVSRTAVGTYSITYKRSFPSNACAPVVTAVELSAPQFAVIASITPSGCTVKIWKFASGTFSLVDSQFFFQLVGRP
jgi:hypothetical protein